MKRKLSSLLPNIHLFSNINRKHFLKNIFALILCNLYTVGDLSTYILKPITFKILELGQELIPINNDVSLKYFDNLLIQNSATKLNIKLFYFNKVSWEIGDRDNMIIIGEYIKNIIFNTSTNDIRHLAVTGLICEHISYIKNQSQYKKTFVMIISSIFFLPILYKTFKCFLKVSNHSLLYYILILGIICFKYLFDQLLNAYLERYFDKQCMISTVNNVDDPEILFSLHLLYLEKSKLCSSQNILNPFLPNLHKAEYYNNAFKKLKGLK